VPARGLAAAPSPSLRRRRSGLAASAATTDQERRAAKEQLIASCDEFREAQQRLWAAEAEEEQRRKDEGEKKNGPEKDRLGGLFGAESLGTVKMEIGELGNKTLALAETLAALNPTPRPVLGWNGHGGGCECPLDGRWRKLFTTAADATFKPSSRRGNATVTQLVEAKAGVFTNIIQFDGTKNKVREFQVSSTRQPEGWRRGSGRKIQGRGGPIRNHGGGKKIYKRYSVPGVENCRQKMQG